MISARTWLARFLLIFVVGAGLGIGIAAPASAHDVLISSDPAQGSTLRSVPSTMSFTFDQPVQNFDPVVSLIGPDGKQYATGAAQISGNVVTGNLSPLPAGAYIAAYRIVSADGHPVTGEVRFTVAAGATPGSAVAPVPARTSGPAVTPAVPPAVTPAAVPAAAVPPAAATAAPATGSGGLSAGLWIGLAVAALVIAAAAALLLRRPTGGSDSSGAKAKPKPDKDY